MTEPGFERINKIARHESGKETEFSIDRKDDPIRHPNLSEANYGDISRVTARIEKHGRHREKNLVLKHFLHYQGRNANRDRAIDAYNFLKVIGVEHVPTTFRAVGESEMVMTDFNSGDNLAIAFNKIKEDRDEKVESFVNFSEAVHGMQEDLMRAATYGLILDGDTFFTIVPKKGKNVDIRIVIADLEMLSTDNLKKLNDVHKIEDIYKNTVIGLAGHFRELYRGSSSISKQYCADLEKEVKNILLSSDITSKIQEYMSEELIILMGKSDR